MKVKIKNIKNGVIKSVEQFILEDYINTHEWVLYVEEKSKEVVKKSIKK